MIVSNIEGRFLKEKKVYPHQMRKRKSGINFNDLLKEEIDKQNKEKKTP